MQKKLTNKSTLTIFEKQNCQICLKDSFCELCNDPICSKCAQKQDGKNICLPCSVSIRNNPDLVAFFIEWHNSKLSKDIIIIKKPIVVKLNNSIASVVEFEHSNIIGSISYRSDGQLDAEAINVKSDEFICNLYHVLATKKDISNYLYGIYNFILQYNKSKASNKLPVNKSLAHKERL